MSKAHAQAQLQAALSGKALPPLPWVMSGFIPGGNQQVFMRGGNGIISKLSVHFRLETSLLFSHNMLSCFLKKNKTEKSQTLALSSSLAGWTQSCV